MILRLAGSMRAAPATTLLSKVIEPLLWQRGCQQVAMEGWPARLFSSDASGSSASSSTDPSTAGTSPQTGAEAAAAAAEPTPGASSSSSSSSPVAAVAVEGGSHSNSGRAGPWLDPSRAEVLPQLITKRAPKPRPLPLLEALEKVKEGARARFDETVEVHVRLKVDPRRGDQMVRGAAVLPHSAGRPVKVAVFAEGEAAEEARAAGADIVGGDELVEALLESKGKSIDFNRAVAHPDMMRSLVKLGKILGPKGLMPNPKVGTLTPNVAAAVHEMRRGRVEFKMDRTAIVHATIGKASMDPSKLYANMGALTAALLKVKPEVIKGGLPKYVSKVSVCSTMGRGYEVEASSLMAAMDAAAAAMAAAGA